jgi:hypothetical protein
MATAMLPHNQYGSARGGYGFPQRKIGAEPSATRMMADSGPKNARGCCGTDVSLLECDDSTFFLRLCAILPMNFEESILTSHQHR